MRSRSKLIGGVASGVLAIALAMPAAAQTSPQSQGNTAVPLPPADLAPDDDETAQEEALSSQNDTEDEQDESDEAGPNEIIVVGLRKSLAQAADKKRNAKQIVDSVVAEDVGKLPDNNVPEALSRITGVQIDRARGEGSGVTIRGLSDIQTTINGNQTNLGDGRALNLADIPAELLQSVEVYKTRTADQVEGGIAGTVNIELRRPLDLEKDLTIAGSARGVYSDISKKISPYISLLIGDRFDTGIGEIGILVNASWTRNNYFENYIESESPDVACCVGLPGSPSSTLPPELRNAVIPFRARYGLERGDVTRPSVNAVLQWRASDRLDFVLEGSYIGANERRQTDRLFLQNREFGSTISNVVLKEDGRTVESLTVNNPNGVPGGVEALYNKLESDLYTTNLEAHWRGDRVQINASAQYNWSEEGYYFVQQVLRLRNQTSANINFDSDQVPGGAPFIDFGATDLTDINNFGVERFQDNVGGSRNKELAAQADMTLELSANSLLRSLQTGFRYSTRDTNRYYGYRDGFPRQNGVATPLADFPGGAEAGLASPEIRGVDTPDWIRIPGSFILGNIDAVRAYVGRNDPGNAARFASELPPSDQGATFVSDENSFAAYAQINYAFNIGFPVDGVAGVRYTDTWGKNTGFQFRPGDATNQFQNIVTEAVGRGSYTDILPSINAILHFTPKLQLRLAYTHNVQRPSFYDLRPFAFVETRATPKIVFAGNPELKAQKEVSYDASLEYYFGRASLISLAGFVKKPTGFLYYSREEEDLGPYGFPGEQGFVEQVRNAGDGSFIGVEATVQSFFDFMPGFWKNFGVSVNGTYIAEARIEYPYEEDFPGAFDSPGTSKYTLNTALYYETPQFSTRIAYNYRSSRRNGVFTSFPEYSPYTAATSRLDAAVNYTPVKFLTLSLEGTNLLRNSARSYFGSERLLPLGVRLEARTVQASARFRF